MKRTSLPLQRRTFIAGLVAAVITRPTFAEDIRTIAILSGGTPDDPLLQSYLAAFMKQLRSLGWIEGRNIHFEQRWASGDPAVMRKGAQELETLAPSAILAVTAPSVLVLKSQKPSIPIVFVLVIDAVALGVVNNLAKPGGNVTGFTNFEPSMGSKWLQLLKEMAPNVRRVGCIFNPDLEPIREVLESDESDVIHWRALDSRWSAACGSPNTAKLRTAAAFVTRAI